MHVIKRSDLVIRDRQRKNMNAAKLRELQNSIHEHGLLHPPVCWWDPDAKNWVLTAGERRVRAIDALHELGIEILCDGQEIPVDEIPITRLEDVDPRDLFSIEFDENEHREDLEWQDRAQAMADLHKMRTLDDPSHSVQDTGRELAALPGVKQSPKTLANNVTDALLVAPRLNDPKIANARNMNEARGLVLREIEEKANAELRRRRILAVGDKPEIELRHADALELLPRLESDVADLILCDPPYGQDADGAGYRSRSAVGGHAYSDDAETAKTISQAILMHGFRICKPRANLFMFVGHELFYPLRDYAARCGWVVWPRPVIWKKANDGMVPWGKAGFIPVYECILFATKGRRGLISSIPDVIDDVRRVSRAERIHAAEKPVELMRKLIEISTLEGDYVLDPCCGSGSTLVAARASRRIGLGIEKDEATFNTAMANLHKHETTPEQQGTGSTGLQQSAQPEFDADFFINKLEGRNP